MAEEIVQRLGLDASQAINALRQLNAAFSQYAKNVQASARANTEFNKSGQEVLRALGADARAAAEAAKALLQLSKAQDAAAAAANRSAQAAAAAAQQRALQGRATRLQKGLGTELTAGISGDSIQKANQLVAKIAQIGARANLTANQIRSIGRNLGAAFVGPQGQIARLLQQLQQLQNVRPPGGSGGFSAGFLGAVTAANLLSNAISRLTNAFLEGGRTAIEYEKTLARIQTIAGAEVTSIDQLNTRIRALSDEFGLPIVEVAAGQYELLSNQIGNATTSTEVLRSALQLANVTGASSAEAVNAISSVLNSYNLATSEAADVSAKLFKAVDLGRFTLDEVADSLGRVTVTAAQLGVSIDEVLAALATLTVTGVPADEAMTLLSNTMRGLLKPTDATRAAMTKMGVSSAEAGIQAFGLLGFLDKITESAGGTASEITQLTENIRVARGVIGLTGDQADRAAENLRKIQETGAEFIAQKNELIINTNAKQVEIELERLKNLFIVDIGQNALAAISGITKPIGGVTGVLKLAAAAAGVYAGALLLVKIETLGAAAGSAVMSLSMAKVTASFAAATASAGAFITTMAPFAAIAVAVGAVAINFNALGTSARRALDEVDQAFSQRQEQLQSATKLATELEKRRTDADSKELAKRASNLQAHIIKLNALYNEDSKNALRAQQLVSENFNSQLSDRIRAYEQYVNKLAGADKEAERVSKDSFENITDLVREASASRFERELINLGDEQKIDRQLERVNNLLAEAANLQAQGTEETAKRAEAIRREASSLAESAASAAVTAQDRVRTQQAERAINDVLQSQIVAETQRAQLAKQAAKDAEAKLTFEKQNLSEIKALETQIKEIQDKALTAEKLSKEERVAAFREAIPLAQQLEERLAKAGDPELAKKLGIGDLLKDIRKPLIDQLGKEVTVNIAFENAATELQNALQSQRFRVAVEAEIETLSLASGLDVRKILEAGGGLDKVQAELSQREQKAQEALQTRAKLPELQSTLEGTRLAVARELAQIQTILANEAQGVDVNAGRFTQAFQRIGFAIEQLSPSGRQAATQRIQELGTSVAQLRTDIVGAAAEIVNKGSLADINPLLEQIQTLAAQSKDNPELAKQYTELGTALAQFASDAQGLRNAQAAVAEGASIVNSLNAAAATVEQVNATADAAGALAANTNAAALSATAAKDASAALPAALKAEAAAANEAAAAQERLNAARSGATGGTSQGLAKGGLVNYRANGGMIYLANGGSIPGSIFKPRGTDTVPAMLSPGEFVVNARSTRKFYSQLLAMNAGRQPTYRADGGPVTNISIGDVNVNAQGGNGQVIGRDVARALNREIRRGTIRLN